MRHCVAMSYISYDTHTSANCNNCVLCGGKYPHYLYHARTRELQPVASSIAAFTFCKSF